MPDFFQVESTKLGSKIVHLQWTAGTSGAAPASMTESGGGFLDATTPITASGSGVYKLNMATRVPTVQHVTADVLQASYSASGACKGFATVYNNNASTPYITVTFRTAAGAAVQLATGDIVRVTIFCSDVTY